LLRPHVLTRRLQRIGLEMRREVAMIATRDPEQITLKLTLMEAQQVLIIDLDEDKEQALQFIKENIVERVGKFLTPS